MAYLPDRMTNKFNQFVRNVLIGVAVVAAIVAYVHFNAVVPDRSRGVFSALIAMASIFGAVKLKVHYRLKGGVAVYE